MLSQTTPLLIDTTGIVILLLMTIFSPSFLVRTSMPNSLREDRFQAFYAKDLSPVERNDAPSHFRRPDALLFTNAQL